MFRGWIRGVGLMLVGLSSGFAADSTQPDCLVFRPSPTAPDARMAMQGVLVNHCGKVVTAYTLATDVFYTDGTKTSSSGGGTDYIMGMAVPGEGGIQPGAERPLSRSSLPDKNAAGAARTSYAAKVNAIIFDDATVVGDPDIEHMFRERRRDLNEWRFWQQAFTRFKSDLAKSGKLARLISLMDVPANQPHFAVLEIIGFRTTLEFADMAIESGRGERGEIVRHLDEYLTRVVSILEKNANPAPQRGR